VSVAPNYHLRELEHDGLVELVEERRKRGFVERRVRSTARWREHALDAVSARS
jgi:hypothetical protein